LVAQRDSDKIPKHVVGIIVPIYKDKLSPEEIISLRHLTRFLGSYDKYLISPQSLRTDYQDFRIKQFEDHFFTGIDAYNELLLSRQFYEAFIDYRYVLIYQLDCLVFSDQLIEWCKTNLDYIGAPWFKSKADPSKGFSRVGNGGFSLRKVESFLKVIDSRRYLEEPVPCWRDVFSPPLDDLQSLPIPQRFLKKLRVLRDVRRGVRWYTSQYTLNEDHFWSDRAKLFYSDFRIAPVDVALRFSFERFPKYCFEQNDHRLPFGCHAWAKWDREFWEPYLIP
jgi:hypothetical protein